MGYYLQGYRTECQINDFLFAILQYSYDFNFATMQGT